MKCIIKIFNNLYRLQKFFFFFFIKMDQETEGLKFLNEYIAVITWHLFISEKISYLHNFIASSSYKGNHYRKTYENISTLKTLC